MNHETTCRDVLEVQDLRRGDVVMAIRRIDPSAANVLPGTQGVVFEQSNFYEPNTGPMVRWMNMKVCNIYNSAVVTVGQR
jgi:hypothetical protein